MLGANQDLMVLGLLLLIGLIGAMAVAANNSEGDRHHAGATESPTSTPAAVRNRAADSAGTSRHASAPTSPMTSAPSESSLPAPAQPSPPPRFNPDSYKAVSRRQLARIAKHADDHVGEQIALYGQITAFDPATGDGFFAKTGATRRWPEGGHTSDRRYRRSWWMHTPLQARLHSTERWRLVVRCTAGTGMTWQRGDWDDELRPAAEQFAKLLEGDVFKAFVKVAGSESYGAEADQVSTVPSIVVDRIRVYATTP